MASSLSRSVILSCEHASNSVPEAYAHIFRGAGDQLESHRGWDPGSLIIGRSLQRALNAPLITYPYTRLLIEPNRSERHPKLFSEYSSAFADEEKTELVNTCYKPYRRSVENEIEKVVSVNQAILHISVHTFTPSLNGKIRDLDIGLLYDPSRPFEKQFCNDWKQELLKIDSKLRVRMNRPYKGTSDGFTTSLRRTFGGLYSGIELEISQHFFSGSPEERDTVLEPLCDTLLTLLEKPFKQ